MDGVTVSVLTPRPGRLLNEDWTFYNGKTRGAFQPRQMTPEELFAGYTWFRRRFYSLGSILKRMAVSRTNLVHNFLINLGYKWSLEKRRPRLVRPFLQKSGAPAVSGACPRLTASA